MKKKSIYRICFIACLCTIRSLQGWGSESNPLPRLSFTVQAAMDTVPIPRQTDTKTDPSTTGKDDKLIKPIVKQVPKSKKQLKPLAVPGKLPVKTPKIIKPKVIIRKVGSLGL